MLTRIKVKALTEGGRKLKHPSGAIIGADGTGQWPQDAFTFRRMRDGDIGQNSENVSPPKSTKQQAFRKGVK